MSPRSTGSNEKLLELPPLFADEQSVTPLVTEECIEPNVLFRLPTAEGVQNLHLDGKRKCRFRKRKTTIILNNETPHSKVLFLRLLQSIKTKRITSDVIR